MSPAAAECGGLTTGLGSADVEETQPWSRAVLVEWAQERKLGEGLDPTSTEHCLWESAAKGSRETVLQRWGQ